MRDDRATYLDLKNNKLAIPQDSATLTPPRLAIPSLLSAYPYETTQQAGWPKSYLIPDKNNWGPRFGFAFRPVDRTVIRGGYGIFFDTVQGVITEDVIENIPNVKEDQQTLSIYQDVSVPPAEAFIGYLLQNPGPGQFNPGPNDVDPHFRNSYAY